MFVANFAGAMGLEQNHRSWKGRAAPGLIFAQDDDVAPISIWISNERLANAPGQTANLRCAELVIEVLSPGE
jgi:hypothetical protein